MRMLFTLLFFLPSLALGSETANYTTKDVPIADGMRFSPDQKTTLYIGHYGETLTYSGAWVLHPPRLMDGIEVVRFHPAWFALLPWHRKVIADSDYTAPENFGPLQLVQLLVIPKNNEGYKDLATLRAAKEKDLATKGYTFQIKGAPAPTDDWPENTFQVFVSTPYRLRQLYAEGDGRIYILTGGLDAPGELKVDGLKISGIDTLFESDFINSLRIDLDTRRKYDAKKNEPIDLIVLRRVCLPLLVLGLILYGIPWAKKYTRPLGVAAFTSSVASAAMRVLAFYGARWLVGVGHGSLVSPGIIGWTSIPLFLGALFYASRRLESVHKWVVRGTSLIATIVLVLLADGIQHEIPSHLYSIASEFSLFMFGVGLLYGFCVGLIIDSRRGAVQKSVLALLFFSFVSAPPSVSAQSGLGSPDRLGAMRRLNENPTYRQSVNAETYNVLVRKHLLNTFQRVELDGIFATDETPKEYRIYFDLHLQPAHNSEAEPPTESGNLWERARAKVLSTFHHANNDQKDLSDLFDDKSGQLTERGRETLGPLLDNNVRVNEIVAHSWGAVLLHNAIQDGLVNPPKRIIVVGVPDGDLRKWEMLAKYTGTDVVIVQNETDLAVAAAKTADSVNDTNIRGGTKRYDEGKIIRKWDLWSQEHPQIDSPGSFEQKTITLDRTSNNLLGHGRLQYYQALKQARLLNLNVNQMKIQQATAAHDRTEEINEKYIQAMVEQIQFLRAQDEALALSIANREFLENQRNASQLALPAPTPLQAAPIDRYWKAKALRDLALKACRASGDIAQADFDIIGPFPTGGEITGAQDFATTLSGCPRSVFDRLLAANRPGTDLTPALLAQWAVEAQPRQPPPYHHRDPDDRPDPPPHPKHCIPRDPAHPDIPGSCEEGYHD